MNALLKMNASPVHKTGDDWIKKSMVPYVLLDQVRDLFRDKTSRYGLSYWHEKLMIKYTVMEYKCEMTVQYTGCEKQDDFTHKIHSEITKYVDQCGIKDIKDIYHLEMRSGENVLVFKYSLYEITGFNNAESSIIYYAK